jgi:hypothetical protein
MGLKDGQILPSPVHRLKCCSMQRALAPPVIEFGIGAFGRYDPFEPDDPFCRRAFDAVDVIVVFHIAHAAKSGSSNHKTSDAS